MRLLYINYLSCYYLKYDILIQNIFIKEFVMKLSKSIVAILALGSLGFAGGDITPVTPYENADVKAAQEVVVEQPKVVVEEKVVEVAPVAAAAMGGYVGLAAAGIAGRSDSKQANIFREIDAQDRQLGLTGVAGYDFSENLGAEVRGTKGQWKVSDTKFKNAGAYLKPQVDLGGVNLYGLAGYAVTGVGSTSTGDKEGDFSYGAGLDIPLVDNVKFFADVVQFLDKGDDNVMGANAGVKYQF